MLRQIRRVGAAAAMLTSASLALAAPAAAASPEAPGAGAGVVRITESSASVGTTAGWLGQCHSEVYVDRAGGWCDGNGPDAEYRGWVQCSGESFERYGPWKWAGDRTKSFAYCPSGRTTVVGGVEGYGP